MIVKVSHPKPDGENKMEERIKRKKMVVLVGALLVLGLLTAWMGTVFGVGSAFLGTPSAVLFDAKTVDGHVIVSQDGKVISNVTLPEGSENVTVYPRTADGKIVEQASAAGGGVCLGNEGEACTK